MWTEGKSTHCLRNTVYSISGEGAACRRREGRKRDFSQRGLPSGGAEQGNREVGTIICQRYKQGTQLRSLSEQAGLFSPLLSRCRSYARLGFSFGFTVILFGEHFCPHFPYVFCAIFHRPDFPENLPEGAERPSILIRGPCARKSRESEEGKGSPPKTALSVRGTSPLKPAPGVGEERVRSPQARMRKIPPSPTVLRLLRSCSVAGSGKRDR